MLPSATDTAGTAAATAPTTASYIADKADFNRAIVGAASNLEVL